MRFRTEAEMPINQVKFNQAKSCLLPNERIEYVCDILEGFLVQTNRRVLSLIKGRQSGYNLGWAMPSDCFQELTPIKSGVFRVTGINLDEHGCHEFANQRKYKATYFDIKMPKPDRGVSKAEVRDHFSKSISFFHEKAKHLREVVSKQDEPPTLDYSYLDEMPTSLVDNAILDLNTILEDKPIHNELLDEARKFLGDAPFFIEESLRDAADPHNGILLAVGKKGYIWIRGLKSGRFMTNVLVDKAEWSNIKGFVYRWQNAPPIIESTYSLQRGMKDYTIQYTWSPILNSDVRKQPWLVQRLNGPWILSDILNRYSESAILTTCSKVQRLFP